MKRSSFELWVGIFVALGIAAVVFLSLQVAGGQSFTKQSYYTVSASFTDVGGLKAKEPVKASGVVVGRVASIQLDPKTYQAKVVLNIDKQYHFSTDVSAEILTSGLLGEQYIGLKQGAEETELKNGNTIEITSSALVLEQLIGKFMTSFAEKNSSTSQ